MDFAKLSNAVRFFLVTSCGLEEQSGGKFQYFLFENAPVRREFRLSDQTLNRTGVRMAECPGHRWAADAGPCPSVCVRRYLCRVRRAPGPCRPAAGSRTGYRCVCRAARRPRRPAAARPPPSAIWPPPARPSAGWASVGRWPASRQSSSSPSAPCSAPKPVSGDLQGGDDWSVAGRGDRRRVSGGRGEHRGL